MIVQRSPEWHEQRIGRITGSRAGAILGLSPWQKPEYVLRAMVREYHGAPSEQQSNPATSWGTNHERQAMLCFMRKTGLNVEDVGFLPIGDWAGASPDGLVEDDAVLELKTPFSCRNGKEFKPLSEQPYYAPQIFLEMLASGRKFAYFAQYRAPKGDPLSHDYIPEDMLIERVEWCESWWAENEPKLRAFHELYISELDNLSHLDPLRVELDSDEARMIADRIGEIQDAIHNLEEEKSHHIEKLVALSGGRNARIGSRLLTKTKDSKSVAYAKAIKEIAPNADLSKWTTVKQGYFKFS